MTEFSKEQLDRLVEEKLGGRSYSEIRADLKAEGMKEEDIRTLIRQVDARVLDAAVKGTRPDRTRLWYRTGLVLALAGLALTIAFNQGWVLRGFPPMAVYAPFLLGILIMFYGRMQQRRQSGKDQSGNDQKGTGAIRRRRPFK
jgi:hypothetical protein